MNLYSNCKKNTLNIFIKQSKLNDMEELEKIKAKQAKLERENAQLLQRIAALEKEAGKPKEKGYTWEECFKKEGYYVDGKDSSIIYDRGLITEDVCRNIATTEKVCKSHLAACQLSHIIERLNEDFGGNDEITVFCDRANDGSFVILGNFNNGVWALPYIKSSQAYYKLLETNLQLLKQYFGIDE